MGLILRYPIIIIITLIINVTSTVTIPQDFMPITSSPKSETTILFCQQHYLHLYTIDAIVIILIP